MEEGEFDIVVYIIYSLAHSSIAIFVNPTAQAKNHVIIIEKKTFPKENGQNHKVEFP